MDNYCSAINWKGNLRCSLERYHFNYPHNFSRAVMPSTCGSAISEYPYVAKSKCGRRVGHSGPHMRSPDHVETKGGTTKVHHEDMCLNDDACVIHNPSAHKMRDWTMTFRPDRMYMVERACEHGVGHPDPDSVMYFVKKNGYDKYAMWVHGCDGCCI